MNDVSYTAIREVLDGLIADDRLEDVVLDAIDYGRRHHHDSAWRALDAAFRARARKAPLPPFKRQIADLVRYDDGLLIAVLELWSRQHGDLESATRDALAVRGINGLASETPDDLTVEEVKAALEQTTDSIRTLSPEVDSVDARLMAFRVQYVFGAEPEDREGAVNAVPSDAGTDTPVEEEEKSAVRPAAAAKKTPARSSVKVKSGQSSPSRASNVALSPWGGGPFAEALANLRAIPASDPQWDQVHEFVRHVEELAEAKHEEAAQQVSIAETLERRAGLAHSLDAIRTEYAGELTELGVNLVDSRTTSCPDEELDSASVAVGELQSKLADYRQANQTKAIGREALKQQYEALAILMDDLGSCVEVLHTVLGGAEPVGAEGAVVRPPETERQAFEPEDEPTSPEVASEDPASLEIVTPLSEDLSEEDDARGTASHDHDEDDTATEETAVDDTVPEAELGVEAVASDPSELTLAGTGRASESGAPVVSPAAAADRLKQAGAESAWDDFIWALIASDDTPAAYWVAQSLEAQGKRPAVPSWLIGAVQGARWLDTGSELESSLRAIAEQHTPGDDGKMRMLALAASLRPVLLVPQAGYLGWLSASGSAATALGVQEIVTAVRHYAEHSGLGLRPEDLDGAEGQQERERAIAAAAGEAAEFLDSAPRMNAKYQRASAVWRALVGANGELHRLLRAAATDNRGKAKGVLEAGLAWRDPEYAHDAMREVQVALYPGRRPPEIIAAAADWLDRHITVSVDTVEKWAELVLRADKVEERGDWYFRELQELRAAVAACLPSCHAALVENCVSSGNPGTQAAARSVLRAVDGLRRDLRIAAVELGESLEHLITESRPASSWWTDDGRNLTQALSGKLLWVRGASLMDDGTASPDSLADLAELVRDSAESTVNVEDVLKYWTEERKDFRFVDRILTGLGDGSDISALRQAAMEQEALSRTALHREVSEALKLVERGVIDGVLADDERARFSSVIEAIRSLEAGETGEASTLAMGGLIEQLRQIQGEVSDRRRAQIAEEMKEWNRLRGQLLRRYSEDLVQPVSEVIDAAFARDDLIVVGECLATVRQTLEQRGELDPARFTTPELTATLQTFLDETDAIRDAIGASGGGLGLPSAAAQKGGRFGGADYQRLNAHRRQEVSEALRTWQTLRKLKGTSDKVVTGLPGLLRYLGFDLLVKPGSGLAIQARKQGPGWAHFSATMSAGSNARPIPQYGSLTHGNYDVVCFWGRPGMDAVCSRLEQLKTIQHGRAIVIYFGPVSKAQRRELATATRQRGLEPVLLDETLLLFLSRCTDVRLGDFLRCSLPYATLNPYMPFVAGDVPAEMYFGRDEMAKEIESIEGSCLVYGGRQLGKSALLRHVQRRFNDPERGQHAIVEPIQFIGDADSPAEDVWRRLHKSLCEVGLISGSYSNPGKLQDRISKALNEDQSRRVIVMFDEADKFLDDDSRSNFAVVGAMKALMQSTDRRFKMVFAGLHQVQRFRGIPNQPLAHLGESILVGPLDPLPARRLILEPLAAMGYRVDDSAVLRILSYTNYHPGLIQLFCKALVERLHSRRETSPPWTVDQKIVETVYYQDLREGIRERFDWTLALDPRYQAIAWSMIVDQLEGHDGFAREYAPGPVLRLARSWWPAGFRGIASDEMRSLLNEMVGLGVLVLSSDKNGVNSYRLRSPNLVRLMGTDEDVENRLLDLSSSEPVDQAYKAQMHRRWIDEVGWSPLTRAQEQDLYQTKSGFSMVFASDALGADRLGSMARTLLPRDLPKEDGHAEEMPASIASGADSTRWLGKLRNQHRKARRLVVAKDLSGLRAAEVESVVKACAEFCLDASRTPTMQTINVVLLMPPDAAWAWLSSDLQARLSLEERAAVLSWARPLGEAGIEQWLVSQGMIEKPDVVADVAAACGGWPDLLDWLKQHAGGDDLRDAIPQLADQLRDASSPLRTSFGDSLGLGSCSSARAAIDLVAQLPPASEADIADFLRSELEISASEGASVVDFLVRMGVVHTDDRGELVADRIVGMTLG